MELNTIYVDPTYAIRSVAANATDTLMCTTLSRDAVHGAMYGFTDFSVGTVRNTNCLIPVSVMIDGGCNKVSIKSRAWNSLITLNDQPTFVNAEFKEAAIQKIKEAEEKQISDMESILVKIK